MKLPARMVEKPWGREILPRPFVGPAGQRIGEICFDPPARVNDLLAKYIFTSEKLSVQVHPPAVPGEEGWTGKEECWLVVDCEPGAVLGIGFTGPVSHETMRAAALDGSIEDMLAWHRVQPGDFFYIPAGTVHAIGGGISLLEMQLNCDVTYRLYDYGRPRDLHLEEALAVARGAVYDRSLSRTVPLMGSATLVEGPYFRIDKVAGNLPPDRMATYGRAPLLVVPLAGEPRIDGEAVQPGECACASSVAALDVPETASCLLAQICA